MKNTLLDEALLAKQTEYCRTFLKLLPQGVQQHPPLPTYFSGYQYATLYDWDQYFEGVLLGYCGYPLDYVRNGIRLILSLQREDGYVPRSFNPQGGVYHKHDVMFKPFLSQLALMILHQDPGTEWLVEEGVYEKLRNYYRYWTSAFDVRGQGLAVWHDSAHTGMDNHTERAGDWNGQTRYCEGIDLNCYLVREGEALAILAEKIGRPEDAEEFRASAAQRTQAIQRWLWDDTAGVFFDYHAVEDRPIAAKYVGAFAAMWAGVATPNQARRMVTEHLLNEAEFWRPYPVPILAASEPGYSEGFLPGEFTGWCNWRANTWMPTNYYTFQGLRAYGFDEVAAELAVKSFRLFDRGRFCEYYTSESGVGTGLKPFWGWSALAIFMTTEITLGLDPTRLQAENEAIPRLATWFAQLPK